MKKHMINLAAIVFVISLTFFACGGSGSDGNGGAVIGDAIAAGDLYLLWNAIDENTSDIADLQATQVEMWEYGAPDGSKTYETTASPTTLTDVVTGEGIETWLFSDGSSVEYLSEDSPEGTMMTGRNVYNADGSLKYELTYSPAVLGINRTAPIAINTMWGNAYTVTKADGSKWGDELNMYAVIGIEDVTVPAGTFVDCAKVFVITQSYKHVIYLAPGVGMVKRVSGSGEGVMELSS